MTGGALEGTLAGEFVNSPARPTLRGAAAAPMTDRHDFLPRLRKPFWPESQIPPEWQRPPNGYPFTWPRKRCRENQRAE